MHMQQRRASWFPWHPFVRFGIWMALLPGFAFGGLIAAGRVLGLDMSAWYGAAAQAHGHVQLVGFGVAFILGVALHFLPRIRGAKLQRAGLVPWGFGGFAIGTVVRAVGQPAAAVLAAGGDAATGLRWLAAAGVWLQAAGIVLLLWVLLVTLRDGPPLKQKPAFAVVAPLFAATGLSLLVAMVVWCALAVRWLAPGAPLFFDPATNRLAVETLLFGCIVMICLAMSARLFPLFFRAQAPHLRLLRISAALIVLALVLAWSGAFVTSLSTARLQAHAGLLQGLGLLLGTIAVRVFAPRQQFPGDKGAYRVWNDPGAMAAAGAYAWTVLCGLLLCWQWLVVVGGMQAAALVSRDLVIHLLGAGLMTLLIFGAGWAMLPGFGGGKPAGPGWLWTAFWLGNAAVALRVLPLLAPGIGDASRLMGVAGLCGLLAVVAFARSLARSWAR